MIITTLKKACSLLLVVALIFSMSSNAFAASFSIRYDADTISSLPAFGNSAADGLIWVDKSVAENTAGGFDVTLSALAQEYVSYTATVKPGGSEEKPLAADVTFVLDMSTSMSAYTDVDDGSGGKITRLAAMVAATNDAIAIIMDANPENRVAIHWFGNAVANTHVGTFLEMGSYKLSNGKAYLSVSGSKVQTTGYVQKLNTSTGKYAAVSTVSVTTGAGTPMQNGIIYGIQKTIADINGQTVGTIGARQPYVFVLSDGAASIGNASWWTVPSSPTTASSYRNRGALTGNVSTGSNTVAAATILSAAYQKDLLVAAYKNYNSGTDYPITFYTVGLGPDSAINGDSNYAWCALNPSALTTLDSTTGNNPSSTAATTTKAQIASYVSSADSTYSKYSSASNYQFSTYYQYADTYPKLDAAFTKLAIEVEAATQAVTMPTSHLDGGATGMAECAMQFTDTLGANVVLDGAPKLNGKEGTLSGGVYTFDSSQSTASVSGNTVTWNVSANDMKNHVYKVVDPKATNITYTPSNALKLTYNVKVAGSVAPDTGIFEYLTGSSSEPATAKFSPTRDNPYYTYVNKYVGNVGKLSEIGYSNPSGNPIDPIISHYVKGSIIGSQPEGTVLRDVYVTSAMVEAAPKGTYAVSDVGRVINSVTMPSAGAYAAALSASLRNCIVATGDDTYLSSAIFAFRSGILKNSGTETTNKAVNTSDTFAYAAKTTYSADGTVTTNFGNNGKMSLELGIDLSAPKAVAEGGNVLYEITLYNYTNADISSVSVELDSDMSGSYTPIAVQGFSLPLVGSLDDITVPAAVGATPGEITVTSTATVSASSGAVYNAEAVITKKDGTPIAATLQPTSNTVNVAVMEAGYSAAVEVKKDGADWAGSPTITLSNGVSTISDLTDVPAGRYEILEDGTPTGAFIDVDGIAPTVTINYYTLNIVAGEGIDSVIGGGVYLAGQSVPIDAIVTGLQPVQGAEGGSATIYGVGTIQNPDLTLSINGDWSGYRWAGWTTNNGSFTVPTSKDATIIMPAHGLMLIATASDGTPAVDVQGKVVEGNDIAQYKIDIAWGAMTFDYSTGQRWNPNSHAYDGGQIDAWLPTSFFEGGNNLITTYNHSNADVLVSFEVSNNVLDGVDMIVTETNSSLGKLAENVLLERVASDGDPIAPSIPAYLWLTGSPTNTTGMDNYIKAAVITVTIEAVQGSPKTPKRN